MEAAADIVEAIDNPSLQIGRGWDLTGWRYSLVVWGVRFTHLNLPGEIEFKIEVFPSRLTNGRQPEASR